MDTQQPPTTTMATTTTATFSLSRAAPGDVRALAELAARAFAHDAHTRVKAAARPPGAFADGMARGFAAWLAAPARCAVLKATDDRDGRLLGFVCWAFRGVEVDPPPPPPPSSSSSSTGPRSPGVPAETEAEAEEEEAEEEKEGKEEEREKETSTASSPGPAAAAEALARVEALEAMTSAHLAAFQRAVMPAGARCLYVVAVAVDPRAQGRGVGGRLLRWGTDRADRAGVFCWAHASAAGAPVFVRRGFREVDRLVLDLDRWAAAGPPSPPSSTSSAAAARERWGEYVLRYMVRQPGARGEEG